MESSTFLSYETYKVSHLFFVVLFLCLSSVLLWYGGRIKSFSIISGIATLLILVTGMGLLANLGIKHSEPWPLWIKLKMGLWIFLAALVPIVSKRAPKLGKVAFFIMMMSFLFIAYIVVHKID